MKSRENDSPKWWGNPHLVTGDTKMLTKSEIALLTVIMLGTLAAWLAVQHPSLVNPTYDAPSIEYSVPVNAFRGVRPSFGEEKALFYQVSRMFHALS
jgi:hypothetical protein